MKKIITTATFLLFTITAFCQSSSSAILSQSEVAQLLSGAIKKEFQIDFPVSRVYKCTDKSGGFYVVLTEKFDGIDGQDTLHHRIRALCLSDVAGKLTKRWEINDFIIKTSKGDPDETSIWFWTKYFELKDIDGDDLIEPVLVYGTAALNGIDDGRTKILIFYKEQKIAIRHQNGVLDDERHTQTDPSFYSLPKKIQQEVYHIREKITKDGYGIF